MNNVILKIILLINLFEISFQQQRQSCINPNGTPGSCTSFYYCASLKNTILRDPLTDQDRSFLVESACNNGVGPSPHICCTKDEEYNNKSPSTTESTLPIPIEELITEQNKNQDGTKLPQLPMCGATALDQRIYNGKDANLGEFPWMALLEYRKKNGELVQNCAGSLINSRYILTAAHCLTGQILTKVGQLVSVNLGEHDTSKNIDCDDSVEEHCADPILNVGIDEIIPHEGYDDTSVHRYHDIGLIRLKNYVNYTKFINSICLPSVISLQRSLPGNQLQVAGWGRTTSAAKSNIKQKLTIPVINQEDCVKKFGTLKVNIIDNQLCAGGVFYEDSCDGDSGGPLMKQHNLNWILEGVVSFGYKCGLEDWPAIYTRVSSYDDWIRSKLKQ